MSDLSAELVAEGAEDVERTQYKILAELQSIDTAFENGELYPHLKDLIGFYRDLESVLDRWDDYPEEKDKKMVGVDIENGQLEYEGEPFPESDRVEDVLRLTQWAAKKTKPILEKGTDLYDEVEEALSWKQVGEISTITSQSGLILVPDRPEQKLRTLRYDVRMLGDAGAGIHLDEIRSDSISADPVHAKQAALEDEGEDLTEAVTYLTVVEGGPDEGWPFKRTLRPVLRRTFLGFIGKDLSDK